MSTASENREQSMLPLKFRGTLEESKQRLQKLLLELPRTHLEKEEKNYLHFTFKSALLGFIDDVEFYFDEKMQLIHFRSASRTGYSDLGVNRKRMDQIISLYEK